MKRSVHKFRLYLAGIALLVGGSFAWASTAGLKVWAEKLQSLLDGNLTGLNQIQDSGPLLAADNNSDQAFAAGEYYFKAEYDADGDGVSETYFLGGANSWGTHAALIPNSVLWGLEHVEGNVYHLDSYQSNGGDMHYLGSNAYVDAAVCDIYFTKDEQDGTYTLSLQEGSNYLSVAEIGFHKLPALGWDGEAEAAIKFNIVSASATIQPGDNVTYLIRDANFDTNNRWGGYVSTSGNNQLKDKEPAWTMEASNRNLRGGEAPNTLAESWHSSFVLSQTISGLPNGVYEMTVQAAVRDDSELWDGVDYPVVFINDASATFIEMEDSAYTDYEIWRYGGSTYTSSFNPRVNGSANMYTFSQLFAEGQYKISVPVLVTDNKITLGAKGTRTDLWAVFDNFGLTYYGYNGQAGALYLTKVINASTVEGTDACNAELKAAYQTAYADAKAMAEAGTASYDECVAQGNVLATAYKALIENISAYKQAPEIINGLTAQLEIIKTLEKENLTELATTFIRNLNDGYAQNTATTEDITSAKQNFKAIVSEELTATMQAGDDITLLITNPTFDTDGEGWSEDNYATVNYNHGTAEVYHQPFDFYQVIPSVAAGVYRLSCTAFNRLDGNVRSAKLYGGISEERLKLVTDEGSAYALLSDTEETGADGTMFASSTGTWPYDTKVKNVAGAEGETRFIPNSMEGANIYFNTVNPLTQQPYYTVSTQIVQPKQGDLRIGIKGESSSEWVLWDNFKLEYIGSNEDLLAEYVTQLKPYLATDVHYTATLRQEATAKVAAAEGGNLSAEEAYNIIGSIGNLIDNIKASVEAYTTLNTTIAAAEERLVTTTNIDETVSNELQTLLATAKAAYSAGSYTNDEAKAAAAEINALSRRLQSDYLFIEMAKAGTLGDLVLDLVENFSDVKGITVTGPMNSYDMANIARMTNLVDLDLTDAQLTRIESSQFNNNDVLQTVRLPKTLTYLGGRAFYDCDALTSVTIAGNITSNNIGSYCFYSCDKLEEVIIEEGITTISSYMFQYCYRLSKLTLPLSLTSINYDAFYNCYSLANIPLPGKLQTIGEYAFYRDNSGDYYYNYRDLYDENGYYQGYVYDTIPNLCPKFIEIPASVTSIGYGAFYNMSGLESVTLNEGLTSIGNNAFYGTKITTATFPSTLTSVGSSVFNSGTHYTSLALTPPTASNGCPVQQPDTLYVPMIVTKAYKQASGWDKFNIVGADIMPDQINVTKQMTLDFASANIPEGYKPVINIMPTNIGTSSTGTPTTLGALEVRNSGTFSVADLLLRFNPAQANYYHYYSYSNTPQSSTLITDGSMRADKVGVVLALSDGYWNFISLPFDVRVGDITPDGAYATADWAVRRYDGAARAAVDFDNTWVKMGDDDIMEAGKGYIIHCTYQNSYYNYVSLYFPALNTVNKNLIFSAANRTYELAEYQSEYAHNRSWNLIGNPYPAYIEIGATDFDAPITVWNGRGGYNAYSPIDDSYILCPGEAFFVQRPVEKGTITFSANARQSYYDVTGTTNRVKGIRESNSERRVFNLFLSDGEHSDRTRVVINPAATMDYETERDAAKFPAMDATATQLYSMAADVQYAINERPLADGSVQLGVRFGKAGTYTFTLETKATESVLLIDEATGLTTEINSTEGYTFTAQAGTADKRFRLKIAGTADGIEHLNANSSEGHVFTIDGKTLTTTPKTPGVYVIGGKKVIKK